MDLSEFTNNVRGSFIQGHHPPEVIPQRASATGALENNSGDEDSVDMIVRFFGGKSIGSHAMAFGGRDPVKDPDQTWPDTNQARDDTQSLGRSDMNTAVASVATSSGTRSDELDSRPAQEWCQTMNTWQAWKG